MGGFNCADWTVHLSDEATTMSLRGPVKTLTARRKAPSLMGRVDGLDGWDGISKVSFKFLHTFWVYSLCICLLVYEIKIVTNNLMGLKVSCQVGGRGQKFQNHGT